MESNWAPSDSMREGPPEEVVTEREDPRRVGRLEEAIPGRDQSKCLICEGGVRVGV